MSGENNTVEMNAAGEAEAGQEKKSGVSRRRFLQILGAGAATTVAGCADSPRQAVFPNVRGSDDQIPGVAVWYHTTCTECPAGCGIKVRTREGRAVKIEGNAAHPINRGGVCALGQASLQNLYDPDRVREPIAKEEGKFKPLGWEAALSKAADALKSNKGKQVLITGELNGTLAELTAAWCKALDVEQVSFDLLGQTHVAKAAELSYGVYGIPTYNIAKAEVVLNFGADFLETFVSPVEYARDWASTRKGNSPVRVIHVEPRLSLTGANADVWLMPKPGTESVVAIAVLQGLLDRGAGSALAGDVRDRIRSVTRGMSLHRAAEESGVAVDKLLLVIDYLARAHSTLAIAGGTSSLTSKPKALLVAVNLINLVLGNVGTTVSIAALRAPSSDASKLTTLIERMNKGEVRAVFFMGGNPLYSVPSSFGLTYAVKKADTVVALSGHLDESAAGADIVLPTHTSLESWGDSRPRDGVYNLLQPVMTPVFDTRSAGDLLLDLAKRAGAETVSGGAASFEEYLKNSWKRLHGTLGNGAGTDFTRFWTESLERGGYSGAVKNEVAPKMGALNLDIESAVYDTKNLSKDDLVLYPFPSVKSFDGRAANRPWLQELPDPITQIVWDSWGEIHPATAARLGIKQGDVMTVRTFYGEINVPAYVTDYVHPDMIAVPMGQGHAHFGRVASSVKGGNVLELLPPVIAEDMASVALLSTRAAVSRSRMSNDLVITQGSNSQLGRGLARTSMVAAAAADAHAHDDHGVGHGDGGHASGSHGGGHGGHHEVKQMYEQREHPFYKWGLTVDLAACTGCSACVVACYAENNIGVVGKKVMQQGRELSWLRIERYYDGSAEELQVSFLPMMCQHCQNAPCEPVCPVYATYHNEEGLNSMVYNRCVGTRYCANNCSYKVRRFNWFEYMPEEPMTWQMNPDVTKRSVGVMEKCTFCVQRINEGKDRAKDLGRPVKDGEIQPACVQSCPTQALSFGNLNDPESTVSRLGRETRAYKVLDHHLNTQPSVTYLEDKRVKV